MLANDEKQPISISNYDIDFKISTDWNISQEFGNFYVIHNEKCMLDIILISLFRVYYEKMFGPLLIVR